MKRNYIYLASAAMMVLAACSQEKTGDASAESSAEESKAEIVAETETDSVEIDAVTGATNVANSPTFNGLMVVSPSKQVTLSLTMGGKVHALNVMPGSAVSRGKVVAMIDNPEYIELQQTYLDASAQLEYLEKEYQRQRTLVEQDAASQKRAQQAKADYLSMKSRADAAASRLASLGIDAKGLATSGIKPYLPVVAPVSGFVTNMNANLGKYLEVGEPICDIIDKSRILLQLTVYEKDLKLMKTGGKVEFRVNGMGKETFAAKIVAIDQAVDSKDYSVKVYAEVSNSRSDFRPGMYVRAKLLK